MGRFVAGFIGVSIIASMVLLAYTEFADIEPNDVVGVADRYKTVRHYSNAVRVVIGEVSAVQQEYFLIKI